MIRLIHIDDDPISLKALKEICKGLNHIQYLGGFTNPREGIDFITDNDEVDLIILDIEMPEISGIEIALRLKERNIPVIFLTNFSDYVTDAFEACALHYLIKPVTKESLTKAINKFISLKNDENQLMHTKQLDELSNHYLKPTSYPKRIFISHTSKILILPLEDVMYLSSSVSYTLFIKADGTKIMSSKNIKIYENSLKLHPHFIRIHRSHIVNKNFAAEIKRHTNQAYVVMTDGKELPISQAKRQKILEQLLC